MNHETWLCYDVWSQNQIVLNRNLSWCRDPVGKTRCFEATVIYFLTTVSFHVFNVFRSSNHEFINFVLFYFLALRVQYPFIATLTFAAETPTADKILSQIYPPSNLTTYFPKIRLLFGLWSFLIGFPANIMYAFLASHIRTHYTSSPSERIWFQCPNTSRGSLLRSILHCLAHFFQNKSIYDTAFNSPSFVYWCQLFGLSSFTYSLLDASPKVCDNDR